MTKYEIYTDDFEFRFGTSRSSIPAMSADEVFETYLSCDTTITSNSLDPVRVASYDSEAEARAAFERDYRGYGQTRAERGSVFWLLRGQLAYLEQNEYDDDGEFDQCGGVLTFSAKGYGMDAQMMQIMVEDWLADNADEMTDLRLIGEPYCDEDDCWCQDAEDETTTYTLTAQDGNIALNYCGTK